MGHTRFVVNAGNLALGATLKNGSGGGAPALASLTGYPMANALTKARYVPFISASGAASPITLDFDQGGDTAIAAIGVHGFSLLSGSLTSLTIKYSTNAQGYTPGAFPSTYGTISGATMTSRRDNVIVSAVTARYWSLIFTHTSAQISLGKAFLASSGGTNSLIDLGFIYWPQSQETIVRYDVPQMGPAGLPNVKTYPYLGKLWTMNFDTITGTSLATLNGLAASGDPFSLVDENALLEEVMIQGGQIQAARKYAGASTATDVWSAQLPLSRLP